MTLQLALVEKNLILNALAPRYNGASIELWMGTVPANCDAATTGCTLIGTCVMDNPAFPVTTTGALTANTIAQDASCDVSGQPTFYRIKDSGGVYREQGSAGPTGADMIVGIQTAGVPILISSYIKSL